MKKLILVVMVVLLYTVVLAQDKAATEIIPIYGSAPAVVLSPDGQTFATHENAFFHDQEIFEDMLAIRLYDVASGEQRFEISETTDYATNITYSPDGTLLASYHPTGFLNLWNAETGERVKEILTLPNVSFIQFMPDNRTILLVGINFSEPGLMLVDTESGAITSVLMQRFASVQALRAYQETLQIPVNNITAIDVLPSGNVIAIATAINEILLWNIEDGAETILRTSEDNRPTFEIRDLHALSTIPYLIYGNVRQGTLNRINLETLAEDVIVEAGLRAFAVGTDDERVAWLENSDEDGLVLHITRLSSPEQTVDIPLNLPDTLRIAPAMLSVAFTPDNQQVIIGGFANTDGTDNQVLVVDVG